MSNARRSVSVIPMLLDTPQAIVIPQPPVIVPPVSEAQIDSGSDPAKAEVLGQEVAFGTEQLRYGWHPIAKSPNGSVWLLRGKDMGAWTSQNPRVWVRVDHSGDNVIRARSSIELAEIDCTNYSSATRLDSTYDAAGKQLSHYIRPGAPNFMTYPEGSPGRAVIDAVCPK